jgi:acyl transferase domain-containing protein
MLPISSSYEEALARAKIEPLTLATKCSMFSSVTGKEILAEDCLPPYWKQNMVSTVRFSEALINCLGSNPENLAMVELGPHPALQGPMKQIIKSMGKDSAAFFTSIVRGKDDLESMLDSVGSMMASHISFDTAAVNSETSQDDMHDAGNLLTDLPSYAWNHSTSLWYESRISKAIRFRRFHHHELLGSRYLEDIPSHPSWRNLLKLKEVPWLLELNEVRTSIMI